MLNLLYRVAQFLKEALQPWPFIVGALLGGVGAATVMYQSGEPVIKGVIGLGVLLAGVGIGWLCSCLRW